MTAGLFRTASGLEIPRLGQGTWGMGEDCSRREEEITSLRLGMDLGMTLIDTAEMYGNGGSEKVVAEAIQGRHDEIFLVSKVLPQNASRKGTVEAAERSLERLRTDRIDLYLLHWPGSHPLEETLEAFQELERAGKIRAYGISNFDAEEMAEALGLPGGDRIACNQILYNLSRRAPELRLIPACREKGIAFMAYSPLEQGRLESSQALRAVAQRRGATPLQVALAWVLGHEDVIAIPKATHPDHVRENAEAAEMELSDADVAELEREFPRPDDDQPLEML